MLKETNISGRTGQPRGNTSLRHHFHQCEKHFIRLLEILSNQSEAIYLVRRSKWLACRFGIKCISMHLNSPLLNPLGGTIFQELPSLQNPHPNDAGCKVLSNTYPGTQDPLRFQIHWLSHITTHKSQKELRQAGTSCRLGKTGA